MNPNSDMYPIFLLDLTIDKHGPRYTQFLSRFPKSLTHIFLSCIESASGIPDVSLQITYFKFSN